MKTGKKFLSALLLLSMTAAMAAGCGKTEQNAQKPAENPVSTSSSGEEAAEAPKTEENAGLEGKWLCGGYNVGGEEMDLAQVAASGMTTDVYLDLKTDGSGVLSMFGTDTEITCKDGKVSAFGQDLYTYEMKDADTMIFDMMGAVYTFLREGSTAAAAIQESGGSDLVTAASADESDEITYGKQPTRHLMSTETEYEVDGGVLYY